MSKPKANDQRHSYQSRPHVKAMLDRAPAQLAKRMSGAVPEDPDGRIYNNPSSGQLSPPVSNAVSRMDSALANLQSKLEQLGLFIGNLEDTIAPICRRLGPSPSSTEVTSDEADSPLVSQLDHMSGHLQSYADRVKNLLERIEL